MAGCYSNQSRDRQGAVELRQPLPDGRGSDWGFTLVHSHVVNPAKIAGDEELQPNASL